MEHESLIVWIKEIIGKELPLDIKHIDFTPCTTYNIQFKESQQMNVFTRLTFTSRLQAFLSQSRFNYLHRGLTPMKSTSSTISRSLIEVHTSNQACKLSISTSNQACKLIFTSNQACKIFTFPFQIYLCKSKSTSNQACKIPIHEFKKKEEEEEHWEYLKEKTESLRNLMFTLLGMLWRKKTEESKEALGTL
jgi:hypothetical protein